MATINGAGLPHKRSSTDHRKNGGRALVGYIVAFVIAGLVSGYLAGLFGIGGGIIRVPIFLGLFSNFGVASTDVMHMSAATSLALVIPAAFAASWKQHRMGMLDLGYYRTWAVGLFVGVVIGSLLLHFLTTAVLEVCFIVMVLAIAAYIGLVKDTAVIAHAPPKGWMKGAVATIIGVIGLWTGTGGGVITTPTLRLCSYPLKKAVALASATGIVVGIGGTIGAILSGLGVPGRTTYAIGFVDVVVFLSMLPTVLITAPFGAKTAVRISDRLLKRIYAIFLLAMACYMIIDLILRS